MKKKEKFLNYMGLLEYDEKKANVKLKKEQKEKIKELIKKGDLRGAYKYTKEFESDNYHDVVNKIGQSTPLEVDPALEKRVLEFLKNNDYDELKASRFLLKELNLKSALTIFLVGDYIEKLVNKIDESNFDKDPLDEELTDKELGLDDLD